MIDSSIKIPVKKQHKCPCCDRSFLALEEFISHLKCCFPIGGPSSSTSSGLDHSIVSESTNMQNVAMGQPQSLMISPKYTCSTCNETFARKGGLTQHMNHFNGRCVVDRTCWKCNKRFTRRNACNYHIKVCKVKCKEVPSTIVVSNSDSWQWSSSYNPVKITESVVFPDDKKEGSNEYCDSYDQLPHGTWLKVDWFERDQVYENYKMGLFARNNEYYQLWVSPRILRGLQRYRELLEKDEFQGKNIFFKYYGKKILGCKVPYHDFCLIIN